MFIRTQQRTTREHASEHEKSLILFHFAFTFPRLAFSGFLQDILTRLNLHKQEFWWREESKPELEQQQHPRRREWHSNSAGLSVDSQIRSGIDRVGTDPRTRGPELWSNVVAVVTRT